MSTDIASVNGFPADRTPKHKENERQAAAVGVPYPEVTRTLRCTFDGIRYEIFAAIMSWRAPAEDCLFCLRCDHDLDVIAPNLLHSVPLAKCACSSSYMTPIDDRDAALLELAHPVSEQDAGRGGCFHSEIRRLLARKPGEMLSVSIKTKPKSEGVQTREGTA